MSGEFRPTTIQLIVYRITQVIGWSIIIAAVISIPYGYMAAAPWIIFFGIGLKATGDPYLARTMKAEQEKADKIHRQYNPGSD